MLAVTGVLDGVKSVIAQATGLADGFVDLVDLRLQSLGYTLQELDAFAVTFAVQSVADEIKGDCNITAVPPGLIQIAVDMSCGQFLLAKKNSGQLDGFSVDLDAAAVKQIQEGDTNVSFAVEGVASTEQRLDTLIDYLTNHGREQFARFRRVKWK